MSFQQIMSVTATALQAQTARMNTTASNLANVDSVASSTGEVYKARKPVFQTQAIGNSRFGQLYGVMVGGIVESDAPAKSRYEPDHPNADESGHVYMPNINVMTEMTDMIEASRTYQSNVQVAQTTKKLMERTLELGR